MQLEKVFFLLYNGDILFRIETRNIIEKGEEDMQYLVRDAEIKDVESIAKIKVDGWRIAYKGIVNNDFLNNMSYENETSKLIKRFEKGSNMLVCEHIKNKEIVGFCVYGKRLEIEEGHLECDCELYAIYVVPEQKQKGIGRLMFSEVLSKQKMEGNKKMLLWCLKKNYPAIEVYKKMGGTKIGEKKIKIGEEILEEIGFAYDIV